MSWRGKTGVDRWEPDGTQVQTRDWRERPKNEDQDEIDKGVSRRKTRLRLIPRGLGSLEQAIKDRDCVID